MVVGRDADIQDCLRGRWPERRDESLKDFFPDPQQQTGDIRFPAKRKVAVVAGSVGCFGWSHARIVARLPCLPWFRTARAFPSV